MDLTNDRHDPSKVLTQVVERLSMADSIESITYIVAQAARVLTGADGATFVLRDGDRCFYAEESSISPLWKGKRFPMEACISGWSMIKKETVLIPDVYQDPRIPMEAYRPTFVKSLCMVPIRVEKPIGAIGNYWASSHTPSPEDVKLLKILANSYAVALENLELRQVMDTRQQERSEFETAFQTLAHDLKNPLSTMMGLAELLQMHSRMHLDERACKYLDSILNTGSRATGQIERMLSLYRLENRKIEKHPQNLSQVVQELGLALKSREPHRHIQLIVQPGLRVTADSQLLHMAIENLLSNAFKYTGKVPQAVVEFGLSDATENEQTFFIRDNGDGFDPSQSHKLFRPLGRLHSDEEFLGTGLGLASVARVMELHGGNVRAEGQKSKGACFFFTFPKA